MKEVTHFLAFHTIETDTSTFVSVEAMSWLLAKYRLKPKRGQYTIKDWHIAEMVAYDKAHGNVIPQNAIEDVTALNRGEEPPHSKDWQTCSTDDLPDSDDKLQ